MARARSSAAAAAWVLAAALAGCAAEDETGSQRIGRAALVDRSLTPLHTAGRYIVNSYGERVKWACVNWYGSYSPGQWVAGGLEKQPLGFIVRRIRDMGFNCIRLSYGTQTCHTNPTIQPEFVAANLQFAHKPFLEVFDAVVEALTGAGLMVIINNHVSKDGWCCLFSEPEGLWYVPGWNESSWIESLAGFAARYRHNRLVVAYDLRNEPHDYEGTHLTWGDGNPATDLHAAMTRAGNAVLAVAPDVLIVVEGLCFASDLRPVREHPIRLSQKNRVVYEVHNYLEFMDHTLFSMQVMSYKDVRESSKYISVALGLAIVVLTCCWAALGAPCPPRGVLAMVIGWTLIVLGTGGAVVIRVLIGVFKRMKACAYGVDKDYLPFLHLALWAIVVGVLLNALAFYRMWPRLPASTKARLECQGVTSESEDEEDSDATGRASDAWAHVGCCSAPGWRSCGRLMATCRRVWHHHAAQDALHYHEHLETRAASEARSRTSWQQIQKKMDAPVIWDRGVCFMFVVFVFLWLLLGGCLSLQGYALYLASPWAMERKLDTMWGFVMEDGHDYTAPVWMGEFGETIRGNYWNNLLRYFSARDVDWAYWPLNGRAYKDSERLIENDDIMGLLTGRLSGSFMPKEPGWENETYGLLMEDYATVRYPWQLLDLQGIMNSPSAWTPRFYPCKRDVLGPRCGG